MDPIGSQWDVLKALLLEQYKESPKYLGILQAIAAEADRCETARWELSQLLNLDTMVGAQLDLLGKICVTPRRQGGTLLSDSVYRAILRTSFRSHASGTPEEIIQAVKETTGSTHVVYVPDYPAGFWILYDGAGSITQEFLDSISPAGVRGNLPCFLSLEDGDPLTLEDGDYILTRGPCPPSPVSPIFPADRTWDGGTGSIDPATAVFTEAWPFQDGTGIGEYPDGGTDAIDPTNYTFTDGSFADDTGGI